MAQSYLAVHEAMEIHELLNFKTVCTLKSKMMQGLVRDEELRTLLEQDVAASILQLQELQAILGTTKFQ
ncbi:hypothetical protein [Tumebacillus flagellatus]|uniref:hypothetical protein n=1 Tax=Tumebacillus flagellatus TaxID=1157490 RepID=UPI00056FBEAD|nr:hypothetical protein [Tumebacillus flagellatus]